jgi:hypothetical protein
MILLENFNIFFSKNIYFTYLQFLKNQGELDQIRVAYFNFLGRNF